MTYIRWLAGISTELTDRVAFAMWQKCISLPRDFSTSHCSFRITLSCLIKWHKRIAIVSMKASCIIVQLTRCLLIAFNQQVHHDVIKWKHFPRYWPFVRGIHRSPVNSPHKGQWHGALMFSLICAWIYGWENNREAGDLRRHRAHYDVIVMSRVFPCTVMRKFESRI